MSQGLQLWDASGNLSLDTTSRLTRWVGNYSGTRTNPNPGQVFTFTDDIWDITVPGILNNGTYGFILSNSVVMSASKGPSTAHPLETLFFNSGSGNFPILNNAYFRNTEAVIFTNFIRLSWRTLRWGTYEFSGATEIYMTNTYTISIFKY